MTGMVRGAAAATHRRRERRTDAAVSVCLGALGVVAPLVTNLHITLPDLALTLVTSLALWHMRRRPQAALLVTGTATALSVLSNWQVNTAALGFMIVVFVFAIHSTRPRLVVAALVSTMVFAAATGFSIADWQRMDMLLWSWTLFTLCLAVQAVRTISRARAERERHAEAAREAAAERRVAEDRMHIAREIHDGIAHHVAVVGVQAAVAQQKVRQGDGDAAVEAMERVREATKTVLGELQSLLSVLRTEGQAAPMAPMPGVADLPALIASFHGNRARIDASLPAEPPLLPPSVDVAAYRLVQEALTNAQKHAPGAAAAVSVVTYESAIDLTVTNDASADPHAHGRRGMVPGFGLRGMSERVSAVGGWLDAGPTPDGGFRVRAAIPFSRAMT